MGSSATVKFCLMFQEGNGFCFLPLLKMAFVELRSGRFFQSCVSKEILPILLAHLQMLLCMGMLSPLFLEYWVCPDAKHVLEIFSKQHFSPLQRKTLMFSFLLAAMLCLTGILHIPGQQSLAKTICSAF